MECGSPWRRRKTSRHVERVSLITEADYRNVVIFPEKFDGLYARLDRPHSEIAPWSIWISYSPDLRFWGESQLIMRPEPYHWDEMKIGPGAPPIKTDQGWLSIYHGVFKTMDGSVYRLGVALHDLENPAKIIGVGDSWILQPEDPWEITGYVHNVVFTCGAVAGARWNGKDLLGRRRHGHVRGRSEPLRSGRTMPASRQTGKVRTVLVMAEIQLFLTWISIAIELASELLARIES